VDLGTKAPVSEAPSVPRGRTSGKGEKRGGPFFLVPLVARDLTPELLQPVLKLCVRTSRLHGPYLWVGDAETWSPVGVLEDRAALETLHDALGRLLESDRGREAG
jgi:hypothetical protein